MKEIPLTQGQVASIDDGDFEWLNQWKWRAHWNPHSKTYYACRRIKLASNQYRLIYMHRQILGLEYGDTRQGDHINHDGLNNSRSNLRVVTNQENHWNLRGGKGYYWNKHAKKFEACISIDNKPIRLGLFKRSIDARGAYLTAKACHHCIRGRPDQL